MARASALATCSWSLIDRVSYSAALFFPIKRCSAFNSAIFILSLMALSLMELLPEELDLVFKLLELDDEVDFEAFFDPSVDGTWFTILSSSTSLRQLCIVCLNENTFSSSYPNHWSSALTSSSTDFNLSLIPSKSLNKPSSCWTAVEFLTEYSILLIDDIFLVSLEVSFFLWLLKISN